MPPKKKVVYGTIPKPAQVRELRDSAGLTQKQASELVYADLRTWQRWEEEGTDSARKMNPATWELFTAKLKIRDLRDRGALSEADVARMGINVPKAKE
jgi:DNA-binding XRE family transcriptional regulator